MLIIRIRFRFVKTVKREKNLRLGYSRRRRGGKIFRGGVFFHSPYFPAVWEIPNFFNSFRLSAFRFAGF